MNDWITDFLKLTERIESPKLYRLWTGISTFSSALERRVWHDWEKLVYPNFYIGLIGPPAARKGTAMDEGEYFLDNLGLHLAPDISSFPAIVSEFAEVKGDSGDSPLTAYTIELTNVLHKNVEPNAIPFFCQVFDCKRVRKKLISRKESIEKPWLNWIAGTQITTLRDELAPAALKQGLLSRFIIIVQFKGTKTKRPKKTREELKLRDQLLMRLEAVKTLRGEIPVTPAWMAAHDLWYEKHDPSKFGSLEKWAGRMSLHLRKLSMVLALSRGADKIDAQDLKRAQGYLEEALVWMPYAMNGLSSIDTRAGLHSEVVERLNSAGGWVTFGKLYSYLTVSVSGPHLVKLLLDMQDSEEVEIQGVAYNARGGPVFSKSSTRIRSKL